MRHVRAHRRAHLGGVTLIELLVSLAIVAIAALASAPYLTDYVVNSRLREAGHALMFEALLAQSEALKRNVPVRVLVEDSTIVVAELSGTTDSLAIRTSSMPGGVRAAKASSLTFGTEGRPMPLGASTTIELLLDGQTCSSYIRCPSIRIDAGGAVRLCRDQTHEGC